METFDFSRLNPTGFERLVRALAFKIFGPAGTVFSAGADGGRDFTYEGAIPTYEPQRWHGYLVLQAKFREKITNNESDIQWLKEQLAKEQLKYKDSLSDLRKPHYYIIATNIRLSGSDGKSNQPASKRRTGGHSKISECLRSWTADLGLRGYDIRPADKISDLLVNATDIRQSYAAWITPGDVLSKLLPLLNFERPDFRDVTSRALNTRSPRS